MTDEQRQLVEDNYNLIYWMLNKYHLDYDEYYDVLAVGLCKAASAYDETKASFSTLAVTAMTNEMRNYNRSFTLKYKIPKNMLVYYEDMVSNEDGDTVSLLDKIPSQVNVEEDAVSNLIAKQFISSLQEEDRTVVDMLSQGMNQAQISRELGVSRQAVYLRVAKLKKYYRRDSE